MKLDTGPEDQRRLVTVWVGRGPDRYKWAEVALMPGDALEVEAVSLETKKQSPISQGGDGSGSP